MVPSRGKRLRTYIAYRVDRYRGTRHTHARALTHTHAHTSTQTHRYSDASSCFPAHPLVTASTATRRGQKAQTGRRVLTDIRQSLDSNGMCVHAWSSCANHITPSYLHTTKYPFVTYPPPIRSGGSRHFKLCSLLGQSERLMSLPSLRYLTLHALIASPRDGGMQSE